MGYIPKGKNIGDGRTVVTTAGTRVQLSTLSVPCNKVEIIAETDNTGVIVVGGTTVVAILATRRGVPLNAGDVHTITDVDNLNKIWIDATVNLEGVSYEYFY